MAHQKPNLIAYTIVETGGNTKDGSINVTLNALPVNGKLHLREPKAEEDSES